MLIYGLVRIIMTRIGVLVCFLRKIDNLTVMSESNSKRFWWSLKLSQPFTAYKLIELSEDELEDVFDGLAGTILWAIANNSVLDKC